jgi:hypothetical protein
MSELGVVLSAIVVIGIVGLGVVAAVEAVTAALGGRAMVGALRRRRAMHDESVLASPLTPPIALIVARPGPDAVDRIRALFSLRYPELEVLVVDTRGSGTAKRLGEAFDLVSVPIVVPKLVPVGVTVSTSVVARDSSRLLVVEVEGDADIADLLNVGANLVRSRLVCALHADLVLSDDALLRLARPFMDDPRHTVASVAAARPLSGSTVHHGRVVATAWPPTWLTRMSEVDHLRSVVLEATLPSPRALLRTGGLLLMRRDHVLELGGFRSGWGSPDADLFRRVVHARLLDSPHSTSVAISTPICWRVGPETASELAALSRAEGLATAQLIDRDAIQGHRRLLPRLGVAVRTRAFLVPLLQLVAGLAAVIGLAIGQVSLALVILLAVVAVLLPATLSLATLAVEELTFSREGRFVDLGAMVVAALVEPIGVRQTVAWWRLQGILSARGEADTPVAEAAPPAPAPAPKAAPAEPAAPPVEAADRQEAPAPARPIRRRRSASRRRRTGR